MFASIGNALGVISSRLFSAIVLMVVITTVIAPSLLKWSLRRGVTNNGITTEARSQVGEGSMRGQVNKRPLLMIVALATAMTMAGCTQETQNKFGRAVQNWTGTNGVLEIYAGETLVRRFIEIDKLSTATATQGSASRPYRFGYGVFDENLNMRRDPGEKKIYFEISDYSTPYVFFEHPHD